jgi:hypothetical protein
MSDRERSPASPSGYNGHDNYSSFLDRCGYIIFKCDFQLIPLVASVFTLAAQIPHRTYRWTRSHAPTRHQVSRNFSSNRPLVHSRQAIRHFSALPPTGHPALTSSPTEVVHPRPRLVVSSLLCPVHLRPS